MLCTLVLPCQVVVGANRLPRPAARKQLAGRNSDVKAALDSLSQATEHTMSLLQSLMGALGTQSGAIEKDTEEQEPEDEGKHSTHASC